MLAIAFSNSSFAQSNANSNTDSETSIKTINNQMVIPAVITFSNPVSDNNFLKVYSDTLEPLMNVFQEIQKTTNIKIMMTWPQSYSHVMVKINDQEWPIVIGPANIVGSAVYHNYIPIVATQANKGVVIIVNKNSPIQNLKDLKNKHLALPTQEAETSYLAKGLFKKNGLTMDKITKPKFFNTDNSALLALQYAHFDAAAVGSEFWSSLNENEKKQYKVISSTDFKIPGFGIAISPNVPADVVAKIKNAFLTPNPIIQQNLQLANLNNLNTIDPKEYDAIAQLGYFTPDFLKGATLIHYNEVKDLKQKGITIIDARIYPQYLAGHIAGAISVPYTENSGLSVDFDVKKDKFDFLDKFHDKNQPLIFSCNGAEFWKSYKAATFAIKHGWTHVYWYRNGFPSWKAHGGPVDTGPNP
jgi:ABC-type phosphate/phosphonate transport system substrate-binding protein/rhodanese-related sulfurtransferase